MDKEQKKETINQYKKSEKDTGSSDVQIALLTGRINQLTGHLVTHPHDAHCKRGLFKLVGHRRRLLAYVNNQDVSRYRTLISRLGLRK